MRTRSGGSNVSEGDGAPMRAASDDFRNTCTRAFAATLPRLRRVVAGLGFAAADADDILQDAFLEMEQRPPADQQEPAAVERWLARVVINRCLLEYRRRQRFQRAAGEILKAGRKRGMEWSAAVGDNAAFTEEITNVRDALREIDGSLAAVLVLRYFCEHNASEIGEILQLPPATVRSRLLTARRTLAERLMSKGVQL